jgi:deoxyribose-phosphate aldolase
MTAESLAAMIDHTLLKPEATPEQVRTLCAEAREFHFKAVCVNSRFVSLCKEELEGSGVEICTVAGFPLGSSESSTKVHEAVCAMEQGAGEIDMVLWIGGLIAGADREVERDIREVAEAVRRKDASLKVIFETSALTEAQIRRACELSVAAGAHWVKTSTGFGLGGAKVETVRLMVQEVHRQGLKVKASGGIRTLADAHAMIEAGAERLGTSSGVKIVLEQLNS